MISTLQERHSVSQDWSLMGAWILVLCLTILAWGKWCEAGGADQSRGYTNLLSQAQQGNADAQEMLGYMHSHGKGAPLDYGEAVRWYRKAAEQGLIQAQGMLGAVYHSGLGVPQDYAEAVKWYSMAAAQGDIEAQGMLGDMYLQGLGVPRNFVQGERWYRKAAEQGDARSQYNLGVLYENGDGVPQDYVQAHLWYNLAAARLPPGEPQENAAKARHGIAARMTLAQIAEAQRLAREWKPKQP